MNKKLLPILILAFLPLTGCNNNSGAAQTSETALSTDWDTATKNRMRLYLDNEVIPFYQELFGYEVAVQDDESEDEEETSEEEDKYTPNYSFFYYSDFAFALLSLPDEYEEDVKTYADFVIDNQEEFGYSLDSEKTSEEEFDYFLVKNLENTSSVKSDIYLNVFHAEDVLYVKAYIETAITKDSYDQDEIVDSLNAEIEDYIEWNLSNSLIEGTGYSVDNVPNIDSENITSLKYQKAIINNVYYLYLIIDTADASLLGSFKDDMLAKSYERDAQHDVTAMEDYFLNSTFQTGRASSPTSHNISTDVLVSVENTVITEGYRFNVTFITQF